MDKTTSSTVLVRRQTGKNRSPHAGRRRLLPQDIQDSPECVVLELKDLECALSRIASLPTRDELILWEDVDGAERHDFESDAERDYVAWNVLKKLSRLEEYPFVYWNPAIPVVRLSFELIKKHIGSILDHSSEVWFFSAKGEWVIEYSVFESEIWSRNMELDFSIRR